MTNVLSHEEAKKFYDRFGRKQDTQRFYEDAAINKLIEHTRFEEAQSVFELGCGTGALAETLLGEHLPANAHYLAQDVSSTMIALTGERLARFGSRAEVLLSSGDMKLDFADDAFDRFVSTYVLDLLSADDIELVLQEAHRILRPSGLLGLVSLTHGGTAFARFIEKLWVTVHSLRPAWLGGCRPLDLETFVRAPQWQVRFHETVTQFAMTSEVLVASKS